MYVEHEFSGKGFCTQVTSMGFLSSMSDLLVSEPRFLDEGFPMFTAYMRFLYFLSFLVLRTNELRFSADEFSTCREFDFSMKLFTVGMHKGFSICRKLSSVLYFTASALANQS